MFEGILKLPAGHYAVLRDGRLEITQYWDLTFPPAGASSRSEADLAAEIRERFRRSVEAQMISDVPIGAFLSAGLDSSSIVAMMARATRQPVRTYTITFPEKYRLGETTLDNPDVATRFATWAAKTSASWSNRMSLRFCPNSHGTWTNLPPIRRLSRHTWSAGKRAKMLRYCSRALAGMSCSPVPQALLPLLGPGISEGSCNGSSPDRRFAVAAAQPSRNRDEGKSSAGQKNGSQCMAASDRALHNELHVFGSGARKPRCIPLPCRRKSLVMTLRINIAADLNK